MKSIISGLANDRPSDFLKKIHQLKAAIMLYESSLECKNFVNLKETQLFYSVIKWTKLFAILEACTSWKTKRGIDIIFVRADNYVVAKMY